MNISYNWLKEYVSFDLSPEKVAEILTFIGLEVEEMETVEDIPGGLEGVVVAQVLECVPQPDSDHLHITKVTGCRGRRASASGLRCPQCGGRPESAAGDGRYFVALPTAPS